MHFPGVWPAITTPFTADGTQVAVDRLVDSVGWQIESGVHGIVTIGTMGEFRALSPSERELVIRTVIEAATGRVPVVVGVSADSASQAAAHACVARDLGAYGVMSLPPLSYRADDDELENFFGQIASATDLPLLVYNSPSGSKNDLAPATIGRLARLRGVAAVKETSEDVRRIAAILELTQGRVEVLVGGDDWALEGFYGGATGWVSGCAVVAPHECVELYDHLTGGRVDAARALYMRLLPLARLDMHPKLVQLFKAAMDAVGRYGGPSRPPRLPLNEAERSLVAAAVARLGAPA